MNFPIEADSFKHGIFFSTSRLLFCQFLAKFGIKCQNINFFQGWYFLNAWFPCIICYYFVQKSAKFAILKALKSEVPRKCRNFSWLHIEFCKDFIFLIINFVMTVFLVLNFVKSPFFWYWILSNVRKWTQSSS